MGRRVFPGGRPHVWRYVEVEDGPVTLSLRLEAPRSLQVEDVDGPAGRLWGTYLEIRDLLEARGARLA